MTLNTFMKPESLDINLERRAFVKEFPARLFFSAKQTLNKFINFGARSDEKMILVDPPIAKVARINVERCLAWSNALCQACYLACPLRDRALEIIDQKPIINMSVCDGCGYCLTACQTVNDQVAVELVMNDARGGD